MPRQLHGALSWFDVGSEELDPGTAEVGVLIPRDAIEDRLYELGREMLWLRQALAPFSELTQGTPEDFKVSTIASSDFTVFVHTHPLTAAAIATAVERVIASYKNILEIRRLRNEYAEHAGDEEALRLMAADATGRMQADIDQIVNELIAANEPTDPGRGNELGNHLGASLRQIAGRIDRGYGVDVRAGEAPGDGDGAEDEEGGSENDVVRALRVIRESSRALDFLNVGGNPILELPPGGDEPVDEGSTPEGS